MGIFRALIGLTIDHQLFLASSIMLPCHRVWIGIEIRSIPHRSNLTRQCQKRCSIVLELCWHKQHHGGPLKECFIRLSPVGDLFGIIIHVKSWERGGTFNFQSKHHHLSRNGGQWAKKIIGYPSLGVYLSCLAKAQIISSSPVVILTCDSERELM